MAVKPENVAQYLESGCGRCELGGTPQCKVKSWVEEICLLREIVQASGLTEEIKWNAPCYTHDGKNILMLSAFKESVRVSFFQGAQLNDPENVLEKPGENSRFVRHIRFTDAQTIASLKPVIPGYIQEAIGIEKSGKKMDVSNNAPLEYPEELIQMFETNPEFEEAFSALTPGRQRGYLIQSQRRNNQKPKPRALKNVYRRFSSARVGTSARAFLGE